MKKRILILAFGICCVAAAARAETMPDDLLQKDYDNCLGGESAQKDPLRAQYCECIRVGMRQWTVEQYTDTALQMKKSGQPAPDVEALAKGCIQQVLH